MEMENNNNRKNNQNENATGVSAYSITSDGFVLLRNGVNIHFLLTTFTDPDGKIVHPILMFYENTNRNKLRKQHCPSCGCEIPSDRPIFLMSNGHHLYPCADEGDWVWNVANFAEVETFRGGE